MAELRRTGGPLHWKAGVFPCKLIDNPAFQASIAVEQAVPAAPRAEEEVAVALAAIPLATVEDGTIAPAVAPPPEEEAMALAGIPLTAVEDGTIAPAVAPPPAVAPAPRPPAVVPESLQALRFRYLRECKETLKDLHPAWSAAEIAKEAHTMWKNNTERAAWIQNSGYSDNELKRKRFV